LKGKSKFHIISIDELESVNTAHSVGRKKVFIHDEQCSSNLKQAAFGKLKKGEKTEDHIHLSMEEYFYIDSGEVKFLVDNISYHCRKGDFVFVPAGYSHNLEALSDLSFIYWGISL